MNGHNVCVNGNDVAIVINSSHTTRHKYAAYLFDDRSVCMEKRWYTPEREFVFRNVPKGTYRARLFAYDYLDDKKASWFTEPFTVSSSAENLPVRRRLLQAIAGKNTEANLRSIVKLNPSYLSAAFQLVRSAAHGSIQKSKHDSDEFAYSLLHIAQEGTLTPGQALFILNSIIYCAPSKFVTRNHTAISNLFSYASTFPDVDAIFLKGLFNYKLGNFFTAQCAFQDLLPHAAQLLYHQASGPAYFYQWPDDCRSCTDTPLGRFNLHRRHPRPGSGIILISCDYGYFVSYFKKTAEKVKSNGQALHLHLIVPDTIEMRDIEARVSGYDIGLSIEYEEQTARAHPNRKTYYSVARYLICHNVIDLYQRPILIADIDIDFTQPLDSAFEKLGDDEISLYFSRAELPWLKVMAGFNFFGKDTASSQFVRLLQEILQYCLTTGRDGWMLDQTALEVAYQNCEPQGRRKIVPLQELIDYRPRQYDNRSEFRATAQKAVKNITLEL